MSVFHVHEWLALELIDANVCAVGELIENRDQLVVGSITGRIWIIDPGRAGETKQQLLSCLLEDDLAVGIIDIAIANFIAGLEQNLIAILSPQKLIIYRFTSDREVHQLNILYEHSNTAIAYNMCIGTFGRSTASQICVQDMTCSLMVFEAENQLFNRSVPLVTALHPGPIVYLSHSDSIITASSSGILISYKYSVLAAASSGKLGKKIPANWTLNLGDYPLNLEVIDVAPVQPSIVILCKRTLFCLTHGGTIRFTYRFQSVAISLFAYHSNQDAYVKLCISTANRMLLFFKDTILVWAAQLLHDAIQIRLCTFSAVYRSMLVILSNSRISVSYLGTEPSLFRLPAPQTRFIDFQQRYKELMELEALIRKKPIEPTEGNISKNSLSLNCSYGSLDFKSQTENLSGEIPSLTLNIELSTEARLVDVKLICSTAFHTEHKYISFPTIDGSQKLSTSIYVLHHPIYDLRCKLYAFSSQFDDMISKEFKMPLNLMCHTVTTQRNAQYKTTIESSTTALDITELFSEFEAESNTAIGFQPYLSETIISIYSSQKHKRYRIQADSLDFIYLFTDELITRILMKQPEAKFNCTLPLDSVLHAINVYREHEKKKLEEEKELERLCILLRNVQATILTKLKGERPTEIDHMNTLLDYTYQQILCCVDRLEQLNEMLRSASLSLSAALNLMYLITSLKGNPLPLDGNIVNNSGQSIWERIKWIISAFQSIDLHSDPSFNDLRNLLQSFCEGTCGTMPHIHEVTKEEHDDDDIDNDDPQQSDTIVNSQLVGQGIPCENEGAKINLAEVTRGLVTSPCYHCICKNGIITCIIEKCESLKSCPVALNRNNDTCCMKCLHCIHLGIKRNNNQIWTSMQDVCTQISCKAGVITSWRIQCVSNCINGRLLAGFCCGLCLTPIKAQDRCIRCDLVLKQWYHCYRFTCPILNCPISQHIKHPKRCCPECKNHMVISDGSNITVSNGSHCFFRGLRYQVHDTFRIDPCSRCSCQPGGIICKRFVCPRKECDMSHIFYKPNVCCPFCYRKAKACKRIDISGNEIIVEHGTKWTLNNNCSNCICINGFIKCKRMTWPWKRKYPQERQLKKLDRSCCHECELKESSCTIFGDSYYITFDNYNYSFHQMHNTYILTQECSLNGIDPQFKIIGIRNDEKLSLTWIGRVIIYITLFNGTFFTIHLLPKKIIRENTKIINIPYVRYNNWPEYRAFEHPSTGYIVVSFKLIGLKVIWDGLWLMRQFQR
ncbi:Protein pthb1 [Dirofilaria immitis]